MGHNDRLGSLQMGVTGEDDIRVRLGLGEKRRHEPECHALMPGDGAPQIELEVQRHLIVPAPPRVHLAAHRPHELYEPPLDGHVDVLVLHRPTEDALLDLAPDRGQSRQDRVSLLIAQHPDSAQHACMRPRPL